MSFRGRGGGRGGGDRGGGRGGRGGGRGGRGGGRGFGRGGRGGFQQRDFGPPESVTGKLLNRSTTYLIYFIPAHYPPGILDSSVKQLVECRILLFYKQLLY